MPRATFSPFLLHIALTSVLASQMALLGFYGDSSLFSSHVTNHLFSRLLQVIGRERLQVAGVPERIRALIICSELKNYLVVFRFEPRPPKALELLEVAGIHWTSMKTSGNCQ